MIAGDPRKKAKGDCTIRPKRMEMSCGNLPLFDSIRELDGISATFEGLPPSLIARNFVTHGLAVGAAFVRRVIGWMVA